VLWIAALFTGIGLWSDSQRDDRHWPKRFKSPAGLQKRILYAASKYPKDWVTRHALMALHKASSVYRNAVHATRWNFEELPLYRLLPDHTVSDPRIEPHVFWFFREINRIYSSGQHPNDLRRYHGSPEQDERELAGQWPSIIDWVTQTRADLLAHTWREAIGEAEHWHQAGFSSEGTYQSSVLPGVPVLIWEDGARLDRLVTRQQLEQEGQSMNHCVGGYWPSVRDGSAIIYSYRDKDGVPYGTMEIAGDTRWTVQVRQFKGHDDGPCIHDGHTARLESLWSFLVEHVGDVEGETLAFSQPWCQISQDKLDELNELSEDLNTAEKQTKWVEKWEPIWEELEQVKKELKPHRTRIEAHRSSGYNQKFYEEMMEEATDPDFIEQYRQAILEAKEAHLDPEVVEAIQAKMEPFEDRESELEEQLEEIGPSDVESDMDDIISAVNTKCESGYWCINSEDSGYDCELDETDPDYYQAFHMVINGEYDNPEITVRFYPNRDPSESYLYTGHTYHQGEGDSDDLSSSDDFLDFLTSNNFLRVIDPKKTAQSKKEQVDLEGDSEPRWVTGMDKEDFLLGHDDFVAEHGTSKGRYGAMNRTRAHAHRTWPRILRRPSSFD